MAFLFKSKKNQDRSLASRDGPPSSGSSAPGVASRIRDEKGSRSTPTGSLNSLDNDGSAGSPDQGYGRQRGQSLEQQQTPPQSQSSQQPSDLPVRLTPLPLSRAGLRLSPATDRKSATVSQRRTTRAADDEPERFSLSVVATKINVHVLTTKPVP